MQQFDRETILNALAYNEFIPAIRKAYSGKEDDYNVPARSFLKFGNGVSSTDSTLLIMPAWRDGHWLGIKQVTLSPHNGEAGRPTLQGVYTLFNAETGTPVALFNAAAITARRTAAKSAVAADLLSRKDSESLLMVGTGSLSGELIQAHSAVRPLRKIRIWEHTPGNGDKLIDRLPKLEADVEVISDLESAVKSSDIVSVATMSTEPLIFGEWLQEGQHLDMVGAYRTDMREGDDEALTRSSLFIDHHDAWHETGDLAIPVQKGVITENDASATLFELCRGAKEGRKSDREITYFKSTGHALEDLTAALFVYNKLHSTT
ncbi:MAG: ornithine cyclodeaminase family protein [Balneolaceae bacterium]